MDAFGRTSAAGLGVIVAPRSVAVVGASEDLGKFGGRVLHHLIKHGFQGQIIPVHPNRPELFGLVAAPMVAAAGPVDVAVIALPADQLVSCIEECVAAGVRAAVIITAQMGEVGGEGAARERRIVDIARAGGMRILGPNCLGLVNTRAGLALTASFAMGVERLPVGSIGVVSQSGALMATMFSRGYDFGIGFSKLVSVGNQADVTETEVFEHLISDEATRAIVLYLEGISDGARLLALAEQARAAGKPVIAVKAGRSEAGCRATFSHTASLAGSFRLFASAARSRGIVLSDEPEAAILIADALVRWPAGLPRGRGVAPCSGSGGAAAIVADRLSDIGMPLAELSKVTCSKLNEELLPGQPALPLDAGALRSGFAAAAVKGTLSSLAADEGVGALVYVMTTQPQMAQIAADFAALGRSSGKPALLVLSAGSVVDPIRRTLRESGSAFCDRLDDALRVLRGLADYADTPPLRPTAFCRPNAMEALAGLRLPAGALNAADALRLVIAAGVPVIQGASCSSEEGAVAAAARIGYPVVAKAAGRTIVHKSDHGGVRLGLADEASVRAAFRDIKRRFGEHMEGVLIQAQVTGMAELILGTVWDAAFGAFVLVGSGGIFAELFDDAGLAPAPVTREGAAALLAGLKIWPVLQGARGHAKADVTAAIDAVVALGWLAVKLGPRLVELDINPLILRVDGQGVVAVDARARLKA